jgi:hypothetical protein
MATNQINRFERWRQRLPEHTAYLVACVIEEVVPSFYKEAFERYSDYAGGSALAVGPNCIPLQRRHGVEWPTVEIVFHKRAIPTLGVHFATLPQVCHRHTQTGVVEIPRVHACVVEGLAFFSLCKGLNRNFDCNFGYRWLSLRPKQNLDREIAALKALLPWLINTLENGIPTAWLVKSAGYVDKHAFLSPASNIFRL